jgi:hypothetical protein
MLNCYGIYSGTCVNNQDPERKSRVQVRVQSVPGGTNMWARGCVSPTPSGPQALPSIGDTVWVMFEGGDSARPVWIGVEP